MLDCVYSVVVTVYNVYLLYVFLDCVFSIFFVFFFQAEDGIRDLVRSRGLGDVYKRQVHAWWPGKTSETTGLRPLWYSRLRVGQTAWMTPELSLIHI